MYHSGKLIQARRRGGFERTPLLTYKRFYIHRLETVHLSVLPFESGPLVSLLTRITAIQANLVAVTVRKFFRGGPARNLRARKLLTPLR